MQNSKGLGTKSCVSPKELLLMEIWDNTNNTCNVHIFLRLMNCYVYVKEESYSI
jgi:hypothetical protein